MKPKVFCVESIVFVGFSSCALDLLADGDVGHVWALAVVAVYDDASHSSHLPVSVVESKP